MQKLDWKRLYPDIRVALGLLGQAGYPPGQAATTIIEHETFNRLRTDYRRLTGKELTASILASRIYHHQEIEPIRTGNTRMFARGQKLATELMSLLDKAGVHK